MTMLSYTRFALFDSYGVQLNQTSFGKIQTKGKCYGKAQHMTDKSLKLLFLKLNNELPILI
ncbi:MAG: hypothetical protein EZS26_002749 [Candidatus Ordinivivax streblomastigis]|uniref:Uncharacterized protein n=1 Tax=Candidatus Ordinivivax streblomastigis TaxID=2540710 RepID=A0A5M8NVI7_9BACT|nr:MAG: hypothetical protein EZS26_002749 [Candidatus Ordinivivax streblomastigis]